MKLRRATLLRFGAVAATAVACGSNGTTPAPAPVLSGVYEAITPGPIDEIAFDDATNYELLTTACDTSAGDTCVETGTYALDDAHGVLSLTNAATGQVTKLPFQDFLSEAVSTQALRGQGGSGGSLTGDAGALTTGNATCLTQPGGRLISGFQAGGQSLALSSSIVSPRRLVSARSGDARVTLCPLALIRVGDT